MAKWIAAAEGFSGEALMGDCEKFGMSRREYRTRLEKLVKWELITVRPTPRGTIAKLTSTTVFDIGLEPAKNRPSEWPSNHIGENGFERPSQRPTSGHQMASNRPLTKKERKKEGVVVARERTPEQRDHSAETSTVEELIEELQREFPNNSVRDEHRRFRAHFKQNDRTFPLTAFALLSGARESASTTTGGANTATGVDALHNNTTGGFNTANGWQALFNNTSTFNTAVGYVALQDNTTGTQKTAIGVSGLRNNIQGSFNTATGVNALFSNTTISGNSGTNNTANGVNALFNNTTGDNNIAIGNNALATNTTASANTAIGVEALHDNTTGVDNVAIGNGALQQNNNHENTAVGFGALFQATGGGNIALGDSAGILLTFGGNNIMIGNPGPNGGEFATIRIGERNTHFKTFIAGIATSRLTVQKFT